MMKGLNEVEKLRDKLDRLRSVLPAYVHSHEELIGLFKRLVEILEESFKGLGLSCNIVEQAIIAKTHPLATEFSVAEGRDIKYYLALTFYRNGPRLEIVRPDATSGYRSVVIEDFYHYHRTPISIMGQIICNLPGSLNELVDTVEEKLKERSELLTRLKQILACIELSGVLEEE